MADLFPRALPVRIQRRRTPGFNLQDASRAINGLPAVVVSRPTLLGNPFVIGEPSGFGFEDGGDETPMVAALTPEQSVEYYRLMIEGVMMPEMHPHGPRWMKRFREKVRGHDHPTDWVRATLRGRNLACWCAVDFPFCHCLPLLEIANATH